MDEIDAKYLQRPRQVAKRDAQTPIPSRQPAVRRNLKPLSQATRDGGGPAFKAADPKQIASGQEVMHQKFGKGKVISVEGEGANRKATVFFKKKGQRVLLLKYAKLQIVG